MTYECIKTYRVNNNPKLAPLFIVGEEYEAEDVIIVNCSIHIKMKSKYGTIVLFPQGLLNKHFQKVSTTTGLKLNVRKK